MKRPTNPLLFFIGSLIAGCVWVTPVAGADSQQASLGKPIDVGGGQQWTVSDLRPSSDVIPYQPAGTLWEATATSQVTGGGVPVVPGFAARAGGERYPVLWDIASATGINASVLPPHGSTTGKIYFDVTGPNPTAVTYAVDGADVAEWGLPSPPPPGSSRTPRSTGQSSLPRFEQLAGGVWYGNGPLPSGGTSPTEGASNIYDRDIRISAFDIEFFVFDAAGNPIHNDYKSQIQAAYSSIYGWNAATWRQQVQDIPTGSQFVDKKANLYWEVLAQNFAERIFNTVVTDPTLVYGVECFISAASCTGDDIPAAERIVVKTHIDGSRDPLNPVTRTIYWEATPESLRNPEVGYVLEVPDGLSVASRYQEKLDFRPRIQEGNPIDSIDVLVEVDETRERTARSDYPDFNDVFIPLRHLLLQGPVADPKNLGPTLTYKNLPELYAAFDTLLADLNDDAGADRVADELRSQFLTPTYYYMFSDVKSDAEGYANYILSEESGIAGDLYDRGIDGVQLRINAGQ